MLYNLAKKFTGSRLEALVRIAFAAHPTCHDVNHATVSHEHLDLIIGFQSKVSKRSIVCFVVSLDVKAVVCMLLTLTYYCYAAYFGVLTCVAWSPDDRFIIAGGQDDLVNIFSPWEQRVIAHRQGHSSFLSPVAFNCLQVRTITPSSPLHGVVALTRYPSAQTPSPLITRRSTSPPPLARYHPAPSRTEVVIVQPVLVNQLENDLLTKIALIPRRPADNGYESGPRKAGDPLTAFPAPPRKNEHGSRMATDARDVDWRSREAFAPALPCGARHGSNSRNSADAIDYVKIVKSPTSLQHKGTDAQTHKGTGVLSVHPASGRSSPVIRNNYLRARRAHAASSQSARRTLTKIMLKIILQFNGSRITRDYETW
ncbi:hypothetical protein BC827DRAFT_1156858 [Russula dissimulans]|nr:hypothetical protein BC827DRAFT_1156858 [Russula dissimulans]